MLTVTAVAGAPERTGPTVVPPSLSSSLHRVSERLHHAAEMSAICADGTEPEIGADVVLDVLADLAPDLAVLSAHRSPAEPASQ